MWSLACFTRVIYVVAVPCSSGSVMFSGAICAAMLLLLYYDTLVFFWFSHLLMLAGSRFPCADR